MTTANQTRQYRTEWRDEDGEHVLIATVRHDDRCKNGHNTFYVTGEVYGKYGDRRDGTVQTKTGKVLGMESCGCVHDAIIEHMPEVAPLIKWHLASTDGPLHYIANTLHLAGDRDCWGLRKGEKRQIRKGGVTPCWELTTEDGRSARVDGIAWNIDADEQPPAPLPGLMYSPWCREGEGKDRELDAARRAAIWPEATDEELTQDPETLKAVLEQRLPALMAEFRKAVEGLGFVWD